MWNKMHVLKDQPIKVNKSAPNNGSKKYPAIHSQLQVILGVQRI